MPTKEEILRIITQLRTRNLEMDLVHAPERAVELLDTSLNCLKALFTAHSNGDLDATMTRLYDSLDAEIEYQFDSSPRVRFWYENQKLPE